MGLVVRLVPAVVVVAVAGLAGPASADYVCAGFERTPYVFGPPQVGLAPVEVEWHTRQRDLGDPYVRRSPEPCDP